MFCDRPAQLVAIMDVTEKRQAEARIAHMAHHDALTGLPNRVLFHERLDEALLRVRRYAEIIAVLYLDLDQFKNVNDTLGHPAGDRLLQAVAERLRTCVRPSDMVARFGGDEFAVLQIGLAGPEEAGALAERIVTRLSEPYAIEGQQVVILVLSAVCGLLAALKRACCDSPQAWLTLRVTASAAAPANKRDDMKMTSNPGWA
jgi:diguanylate cyclase (GGDEF)-like protein